jgi:hypothetical protein
VIYEISKSALSPLVGPPGLAEELSEISRAGSLRIDPYLIMLTTRRRPGLAERVADNIQLILTSLSAALRSGILPLQFCTLTGRSHIRAI